MAKKKAKTIEQRITERPVLEKFAEKKRWCELIDASELIAAIKDKKNPKELLGDDAKNPGCYKWWAKKDDVEILLSKILFDDEKHKNIFSETDYSQLFENEENLYCIYVGKANNLYDRLSKQHAKNTETSTLRRTICSLACNQDDTLEKINKSIDGWLNEFKVQYFPLFECERTMEKSGKNQVDYRLKGVEIKGEKKELSLLDLEYFFINKKFHILNVKENDFADYTEEKLDEKTIDNIKKIVATLKKCKWSKKKIVEIKKKN